MNTDLILRIASVIEENPDHYDQSVYCTVGGNGIIAASEVPHTPADQVGECGTIGCIAGWLVALTPLDERPEGHNFLTVAATIADIGPSEADYLFSPSWGPRESRTVSEELRRIAAQGSVFETATAGYGGTATVGYSGTATAGDSGTATAGVSGTATAGDSGTATAGDRGTATAGYSGTAAAGYGGTATAGNRGTATAGDRGTATAGDRGTATAGYAGTLVVRDRGLFPVVGLVGTTLDAGGDLLVAGVAYRLDPGGQWMAVS